MPHTENSSLSLWYLQNRRLYLRLQADDYYNPFLDACAKNTAQRDIFERICQGKQSIYLITLEDFGLVFQLGEKEAFLRIALGRTTWG